MNTIVKHTVGFIGSIVLTLLAVFVTLYTSMALNAKITIIFGFAFIQAAVQLLMFMHLTEGKDGNVQGFKVIFALIITLITVIGTYWVMQGGHSQPLIAHSKGFSFTEKFFFIPINLPFHFWMIVPLFNILL
jgi:cytochrome aa3-600 menaquinol oxidase subunit 4